MHRTIVMACGLACGLAACSGAGLLGASPVYAVAGDWTGTFESSWGVQSVSATFEQHGVHGLSGSFVLDGQRASGTVYGALRPHERYDSPDIFQGTLTISYPLAGGASCTTSSTAARTFGHAMGNHVAFMVEAFDRGDCPDLPTNVTMQLWR